MRAGIVISMRINPRDCQGILDVMQAAGIDTKGKSFSVLASLALSSLLESAREGKHIPEPDEFQYLNRMQPFLGRQRNGQKAKVTEAIGGLGPVKRVPSVVSAQPVAAPQPAAEPALSIEEAQAARRLEELLTKKNLAEDGNPNVIWQQSDQAEYDRLVQVIYGG